MRTEESPTHNSAVEVFSGFARALRYAGVPVTQDRTRQYLTAVALLGTTMHEVRAAGHVTLCSSPSDLERHDQVFDVYFDANVQLPEPSRIVEADPVFSDFPEQDGDRAADQDDSDPVHALASNVEVLKNRDVAELSVEERARLALLVARIRPRMPRRRSVRRRPAHRGSVDARRTLRSILRHLGEPSELHFKRRTDRSRNVVLLVDVSGSMTSYADVVLRLAHRFTQASPRNVETFSMGTRLSHLTRAMQVRDPEMALAAAGEMVPDWSGGTRLGDNLSEFVRRWGRPGLARGAVVVIFSDGWERGDTTLLSTETERLRRLAHRIIWVNPHRGKPGYEPLQQGVVAVMPHVDDFVAGHSLSTYEELSQLLGRS